MILHGCEDNNNSLHHTVIWALPYSSSLSRHPSSPVSFPLSRDLSLTLSCSHLQAHFCIKGSVTPVSFGGGRLFCNHSSPSHTHPLVLAWAPGTSAVKSFSLSNQVSPIPSSWWQRCPLQFSDGWAHALPFLSSRPGSTSAERLDNWLLPCARISVLHFPPLVGSSLPADQWAIYLPNPTLQSTS